MPTVTTAGVSYSLTQIDP